MSTCDTNLYIPYISSLPSSVVCDDKVPDAAKIYFSQLLGLCSKHGYCWATDEQLAKMKNTSIRSIERWNKILSDNGHIIRKTKNEMVKSKDGGPDKWIKKRKIYCLIKPIEISQDEEDEVDIPPVENEDSKKDCGTATNEGIYEPATNGGIYEPATNGGYKNKTLNVNPLKEESPSSSFFHLSLNSLDIPEVLKYKVSQENDEAKINVAVKRTLDWKGRTSDEAGLMAILKHFDTWKDAVSPEEKKQQTIKENSQHLASLKSYDMKSIRQTLIYVSNTQIEFVCGPKAVVFNVEEPGFIKKTTEYMEYLNQYQK